MGWIAPRLLQGLRAWFCGLTCPFFHYSGQWQLLINTGTTIITFLMVFPIQQSQNKDSVALHLKLNELLAANRSASNTLIGIEDASEVDLRRIADAYRKLAQTAAQRGSDPRPIVEGTVTAAGGKCQASADSGLDM